MERIEPVFDHIEAFEDGPAAAEATMRAAKIKGLQKPVVVRFAKDLQGVLDVAKARDAVWFDVMRSLQAAGRPVYVEIDRATGQISQFLQPREQPVGEIRETEGGDFEVELLLSHAVHVLRRSHPRFKELRERLQEAQRQGKLVWVTETLDSHEILEVR
jgi:hypothetical protein